MRVYRDNYRIEQHNWLQQTSALYLCMFVLTENPMSVRLDNVDSNYFTK